MNIDFHADIKDIVNISCEIGFRVNATKPCGWLVNIGSGNGLLPWGNKPLPEPMLTQFFNHHMVSPGHNELIGHTGLRPLPRIRSRAQYGRHHIHHKPHWTIYVINLDLFQFHWTCISNEFCHQTKTVWSLKSVWLLISLTSDTAALQCCSLNFSIICKLHKISQQSTTFAEVLKMVQVLIQRLIFMFQTKSLSASDDSFSLQYDYSLGNSSLSGQNGRHFADGIFRHIFLNENVRISIQVSLKFVPKGSIDNKWALVQVMAWRRTGDKPLSEPMLTQFIDSYMRH